MEFKTICTFLIVPSYPGSVVPLEIFMAWKFGMGFFWGKFWSTDFWGFCSSPMPPFDYPCHLKSRVPLGPSLLNI